MSKQHTVMQLLAKNNIILDQDSITMIEDHNPYKEYRCNNYFKSKGFTILHTLILIANKLKTGFAKSKTGFAKYLKLSKVIEEYILLYPEEVNKVNAKGWSALLLAVSNEVPEIAKLLVKHNADVNIKNNDGVTTLIYASTCATESSQEIVKLLVEHRCNVNITNNYGESALMKASYNATESSVEIVKLLLKHDANISIAQANRRCNVNAKSSCGMTALMYASINATESSLEVVKLLVEHNANVNVKNNFGSTALMKALYKATEPSLEIVKLLLSQQKCRCNVNIKNNDGSTALMYALYNATESTLETVKLLLKHNASINIKNNYEQTALIISSLPEITKLLLEHDSIPNNEELIVVKNINVLNAKN